MPSAMTNGRMGLVLRDPLPWNDALRVVRTAEASGYEAVFVPEIQAREAFSTLTGFGGATERLRLGAGVVTLQTRTPAVTAMAAATVHDVTGGRLVLGIGAGSGRGAAGLRPSAAGIRPLALTEEYTRIVRGALAGEDVTSEAFGLDGFRLGLSFDGDPGPPGVWLAALGDRMVALAGRDADGVLLNWCTPERVSAARRTLADAAEAAGRDPASLTIAVYVRAALEVDETAALGSLRQMTGQYASYPAYRAQMAAMGFSAEAAAAAGAHAAGRSDDVPESLVRTLIILGDRNDALDRFRAYHDAGADLVLCYPVVAGDHALSSVMGTAVAAAPSPALDR
jgi:alkanesulfonate monooxygenase SsuD/methylene tetrahydromethanopterin reductase-like flavin-dependent oxidoreductase (luciferase family)